jgi:two-component system, sensor histidine kinase and response regulator
MMSSYEQRKLQLELFYLKPGLNIPEKSEASEINDVAVRNEIMALLRTNERLQKQLVSLKEHNQELEDYAHTVAHNLKDPLSVLILTSDAIAEIDDLSREELKEYMQQIKITAYSMNGTIDNLLLLSEVKKEDAPLEPINMGKVVNNIQQRLSYLVKEYQGNIIAPTHWPTAIGYAPWIEEVWVNYLSNALIYGGRPPIVRLGAAILPDNMISFWVLDNGFGISPERQADIFNQFNHFNQENRPGHGLGLSIVRHIVEKLGGKVGLESKAGQGSLFYFTLPAGSD